MKPSAAWSVALVCLIPVGCKARGPSTSAVREDQTGTDPANLYQEPPLSDAQIQSNQTFAPKAIAQAGLIVQHKLQDAQQNPPDTLPSPSPSKLDTTPIATRDTHAKTHGCLKGSFHVDDNLGNDQDAAVGLFSQPGKDYKAVARFANGTGSRGADSDPDARGLAVKLFDDGAPRQVLTAAGGTSNTYDFIFNNAPVFFVHNVEDYYNFLVVADQASSAKMALLTYLASGAPGDSRWKNLLSTGARLTEMQALVTKVISGKATNPLTEVYWGGSAVRWGAQPAKYIMCPIPCKRSMPDGTQVDTPADFSQCKAIRGTQNTADRNFLRTAMKAQIANTTSCFDFYAQIMRPDWTTNQTTLSTYIEDTTQDWTDADKGIFGFRKPNPPAMSYHKLGRLTFPAGQTFDADSQMMDCENLSFSTWRTVAEHQPLGALNRLRRDAYPTISKQRHDTNIAQGSDIAKAATPTLMRGDEPGADFFTPAVGGAGGIDGSGGDNSGGDASGNQAPGN